MTIFKVKLASLDDAKNFVAACEKHDCDIDYTVGRYCIDAKSIMGVIAADIGKEATVVAHSVNDEETDKLCADIHEFII